MPTSLDKKVSVIVPCYNYAHYLDECLESVLTQTYKVHEIIVVDDGGKDNCKEVCDKYPAVTYLRKENGGLSSARNAGIRVATGSLISCLDSDDKLVPACIEEQVKLMTDDMTIAQVALMEFGDRYVVALPTPNTRLERILKSNTIFCNSMFTKRAWEMVGGFDESEIMRLGLEDWEFFIRMMGAGCVVRTSDFIGLRYRVHEGQMTQATTHPYWDKITAYMTEKNRELYEKYDII